MWFREERIFCSSRFRILRVGIFIVRFSLGFFSRVSLKSRFRMMGIVLLG